MQIQRMWFQLYCMGWRNSSLKCLPPLQHWLLSIFVCYRKGYSEGSKRRQRKHLEVCYRVTPHKFNQSVPIELIEGVSQKWLFLVPVLNQFSKKHQLGVFTQEELHIMKLHYRGNSYESHPQVIETHDTGITAKYRGLTYQGSRPLARTCSQPLVNLKYRGMAYTIGQAPAIKSQSQPDTSLIHA